MAWMEWRWVVLVVLFALFVVGGYLSDRSVLQAVSELENLATGLEVAVSADNWAGAREVLDGLYRRWPQIRRSWDLRMHRDEMDDLDLSLARIRGYVGEKDKVGILSELGAWQTLLTHVEQKEVFRWRNLL